jgi:hypothetical protein
MSFGKKGAQPAPQPEPTSLEDESISSSEEAVPVPWLAGERKISLKWISRVYNQRAQEAPVQRPGKKG